MAASRGAAALTHTLTHPPTLSFLFNHSQASSAVAEGASETPPLSPTPTGKRDVTLGTPEQLRMLHTGLPMPLDDAAPSAAPRGRGRPRLNPKPAADPKPARKRGRPSKVAQAAMLAAAPAAKAPARAAPGPALAAQTGADTPGPDAEAHVNGDAGLAAEQRTEGASGVQSDGEERRGRGARQRRKPKIFEIEDEYVGAGRGADACTVGSTAVPYVHTFF